MIKIHETKDHISIDAGVRDRMGDDNNQSYALKSIIKLRPSWTNTQSTKGSHNVKPLGATLDQVLSLLLSLLA
ncbi:hypothetical protein AXFE_06620 [Acidithrix ferrooxidans]|uniref:Uncharacterized protein n=1 Tax=Acidithrix ferrooxidans TaxID=1280514 RepID=A0A0D8HKN4_9ACTN|nr:hypothetical protein AXFE_06620 [Acidithrix ferrooxidans]